MRISRFRWWHIAEVLPIEEDLFGAEAWLTPPKLRVSMFSLA